MSKLYTPILVDTSEINPGMSYREYVKKALAKGQIIQSDIPYVEKRIPTTRLDKKAARIGKRKLVTTW